MWMRIGAIHMGLEANPQMEQLLSGSVDVVMKSIEGELRWKY